MTTKSAPRFVRIFARVSGARLSASDTPRSSFMREMVSPGTVRSWSPAASSVVSISERAVDSHAEAAWPERFLNPSTATDRRGARDADGPPGVAGPLPFCGRRKNAAATARITAPAATAEIHTARFVRPPPAARSRALCRAVPSAYLDDGSLSRHRRTTGSHRRPSSAPLRSTEVSPRRRRRRAESSEQSPEKGLRPSRTSHITTPKAYTSAAGPTLPPCNCSGAM